MPYHDKGIHNTNKIIKPYSFFAFMLPVANFANTKLYKNPIKMIGTFAYVFSSESTQ